MGICAGGIGQLISLPRLGQPSTFDDASNNVTRMPAKSLILREAEYLVGKIDNNATERDIRGVAVGRNNWIFFGSDRGGETAAILRSFTASCQRVGVEPFAWFKDVLSRIATHPINRIAEFLPHNWKPVLT